MINGVTTRDGIRTVASPRRQARSPTQSTVRYDRDHPYSWRKAGILTPFTSCERHGVNGCPCVRTSWSGRGYIPGSRSMSPSRLRPHRDELASQGWEGGVGGRGFELEIGDITRYRNRHPPKIFPNCISTHASPALSPAYATLCTFVGAPLAPCWQILDPEISVNRLGNEFPQHTLTTTLIHSHWKSSHTPT